MDSTGHEAASSEIAPLRVARLATILGASLVVASFGTLVYGDRPPLGAIPHVVPLGVGAFALLLVLVSSFASARRTRAQAIAARTEGAARSRAFDESTAELERARAASEALLAVVGSHVFVIDPSYAIRERYADDLADVLHDRDSDNLLNVLQRLLSARLFQTARDYLALLFDTSKKERTIVKINPLDAIEIAGDGDAAPRYVAFAFNRVVENGAVARVLVSVLDVTERIAVERALRESERVKVRQFELLIGILHVEPRDLDGFVALASENLTAVDGALEVSDFATASSDRTSVLRARLDLVLQRVHNIKGNAALLRLDYFERRAQTFEQHLVDLRHRPSLGGDDFIAVVIELSEFRADFDDLRALRAKLAAIERSARVAEEIGDDLVSSVTELASTLAKRLGRDVIVDADGFDSRALAPDRRLAVKDVLIQLTRNSIAHGIETPQERIAAGKPRVATLEIHPTPGAPDDAFAFTFRDDGRGLDADGIRARAIANGLLTPAAAASADDSEVAGLIFVSGFSTAESVTADAGRGLGMNVIKQRVVDDCGGEIALDSEAGRYCEFSFVFPARVHAIAS
jgi:two-component system chemotaxis sensor kinase CheA